MRWDALFRDMENQLAAGRLLELETDVAELIRMEESAISLADRIRGAADSPVTVVLSGNVRFRGTVSYVGQEWLLLTEGERSVLVPLRHLTRISDLPKGVLKPLSQVPHTLAAALRTLARERAAVRVYLVGADMAGSGLPVTGVLDRVGSDFVELAVVADGEPRRESSVRARLGIPFTAVVAISSRAQAQS
ncbi:hypothetical protein [Arthrobacter sp. H14-L1]|uniref:hypothetical protein n=1 Tax=Arthrobacter sp. H14-L1 TaxID=2996697 RepID=UPI00226E138F|nr:hypothetical protein [Arthrobacter sp. H14-L1]MCY0903556.1 hypothetical protein [Arthrobacter sp. H14-L1]